MLENIFAKIHWLILDVDETNASYKSHPIKEILNYPHKKAFKIIVKNQLWCLPDFLYQLYLDPIKVLMNWEGPDKAISNSGTLWYHIVSANSILGDTEQITCFFCCTMLKDRFQIDPIQCIFLLAQNLSCSRLYLRKSIWLECLIMFCTNQYLFWMSFVLMLS